MKWWRCVLRLLLASDLEETYRLGHDIGRMNGAVDKWILDHAYSPDDIVIGDGTTPDQLVDLQELLDAARPGWRDLFKDKA